MTARPCRVWSEGLAPGTVHVARDRVHLRDGVALGEARLRFHRYEPTASMGRFEAACHAVRGAYCEEAGIPVVRRLSGGGALYLCPGQCCLSLSLPRDWLGKADTLTALMARLNRALARALGSLGIPARSAFPNDVEVDGRKLAAGFLAVEPEAILYHGVILEHLDVETLLRVLRFPREKLSAEGILSARQRFVTLEDLPGGPWDMDTVKAAVTRALTEELALETVTEPPARCAATAEPVPDPGGGMSGLRVDWEAEGGGSWRSFLSTPGGVLHLRIVPDPRATHIREATLAGAVHLAPVHLFADLCRALEGAPLEAAEVRLVHRLREAGAEMPGFGPEPLARLLRLALGRRGEQALGLTAAEANRLMVHRVDGSEVAPEILSRATVMLVPYCAKPAWCKWRHEDDCVECGGCEVGEAYRLARARGMQVVTITRYEHLREVLSRMQHEGAPAYLGMCCRHFYLKRAHAFRAAGIPAVLMDITGSNCYELNQEDAAYEGRFTAEAALDAPLLEKVMTWVPGLGGD